MTAQITLAPNPLTKFNKGERLFIYTSGLLKELQEKEDALDEVLDEAIDEGEEPTFDATSNFYHEVCYEYGLHGEAPAEQSLYSYQESDPAGTLEEHKISELWPEIGRIETLMKHYDALSPDSEEMDAHARLSEAFDPVEQFDLREKILDILVEALGTKQARTLEYMVGGDVFTLEFLALLARDYIGKVDGWDENTYRKAADLWDNSMSIPLHEPTN